MPDRRAPMLVGTPFPVKLSALRALGRALLDPVIQVRILEGQLTARDSLNPTRLPRGQSYDT